MPPRVKRKSGGGLPRGLLYLGVAALVALAWWRLFRNQPEALKEDVKAAQPAAQRKEAAPAKADAGKSAAQLFVERTLKENRVVIFSKSYCGFSRKAKMAMANALPSDKYLVVELDQREDGPEIQGVMQKRTGASTVPRVFIDNVFIGGGNDLEAMDQNGELKKMLIMKGIL